MLMKQARKTAPSFLPGDIVNLAGRELQYSFPSKPDGFVVISQTERGNYKAMPAWKSKAPFSTLIWAYPSNIWVKAEYLIEVEQSEIERSSMAQIKNKKDALERLAKNREKLIKRANRTVKQKSRCSKKQIEKISLKLDIKTSTEMESISNPKPCQGGLIAPK